MKAHKDNNLEIVVTNHGSSLCCCMVDWYKTPRRFNFYCPQFKSHHLPLKAETKTTFETLKKLDSFLNEYINHFQMFILLVFPIKIVSSCISLLIVFVLIEVGIMGRKLLQLSCKHFIRMNICGKELNPFI